MFGSCAKLASPDFNPNLFEPANFNYSYQINDLYAPTAPLLNRATQGQYPLGSVFKIITMSAALESGLFTKDSEYDCGYFFTEVPGIQPHDWTYDHYLEDGKTQPSGRLNLMEGLMRSCNPWFMHIGLDFYNRGMYTEISDMARGFGLGSSTGIEIGDIAGQIPDPTSEVDAFNLAIAQGNTLITPLQVADFIAAVGNGGTLYKPSIIDQIVPVDGEPTYVFTPTVRGTLPISSENLSIVQDAMVTVVMDPRGTAYRTSAYGLNSYVNSTGIPVAGKTGTAESGYADPHAWFAGYTFAGLENRPDIAVAVLVENGANHGVRADFHVKVRGPALRGDFQQVIDMHDVTPRLQRNVVEALYREKQAKGHRSKVKAGGEERRFRVSRESAKRGSTRLAPPG